jgi:hypothetical protein
MKPFFLVIGIVALFIMIVPLSNAQALNNQSFFIVSGNGDNSAFLSVPLNSSNVNVFTNWEIYFIQSGPYSMSYNGTVIKSGYADSGTVINQSFPANIGAVFNVSITFQGHNYHFNDIAQDSLSFINSQSVSVSTSYPGENQFLTASNGQEGVLLYPNWEITLRTDFKENYTITLNGGIVKSGEIDGITSIPLSVNGTTATVMVSLGGKVYTYRNEFIANIPLQKYYGPKGPQNTATFDDIIFGLLKGAIAVSVLGIIAYVSLFPVIKARKNRKPIVR